MTAAESRARLDAHRAESIAHDGHHLAEAHPDCGLCVRRMQHGSARRMRRSVDGCISYARATGLPRRAAA